MAAAVTGAIVVVALAGAGVSPASGISSAAGGGLDDDVRVYDIATGEPVAEGHEADALNIVQDLGYNTLDNITSNAYDYTVKLIASPRVEQYRSVLQSVARDLWVGGFARLTIEAGQFTRANDEVPGEHEIFFRADNGCISDAAGCARPFVDGGELSGELTALSGSVHMMPVTDSYSSAGKFHVLAHEIGHVLGLDHYSAKFDGVSQIMYPIAGEHESYQSGDKAGLAFLSRDVKTPPFDPTSVVSVDRIQGADRFASAAAVSRAAYPDPGSAPIVVVASSDTFPDALSAGPAASKLGGPLLLTQGGELPAATKAEIKRLKPSKLLIVGGLAAVSTGVEAELEKLVPSIDRVSGSDRYETSRKLAEYAFDTVSTAFVASGDAFPDALALGAAAASQKAPMLLVSNHGSAASAAADTAKSLGATSIRIAGGTNAVNDTAAFALHTRIADVRRFSGADRFQTAAAISVGEFAPTTKHAYIVNGMNYPDGLVAAPLASTTTSPVYLADATCVPQSVISELDWLGVTRVTLIGGGTVLTDSVAALNTCM